MVLEDECLTELRAALADVGQHGHVIGLVEALRQYQHTHTGLLGRSLFRALQDFAVERSVRTFTGDVASGNTRVLTGLRALGWPPQMESGYGTYHFTLSLGVETVSCGA